MMLRAFSVALSATALSCALQELPRRSPEPSAVAIAAGDESLDREEHEERRSRPSPPTLVPTPPALHTGTVVPARHPDRATCSPFQEGAPAWCVTGFVGPMVVTDLDFGGDCPDELMVLAVSVTADGKVDVSHPHWYLENPAHARLAIHGSELVVEATDELVFAARPTSGGVAATTGSACFVTWASKGPANPASVYPRLE